MRRARVHCRIHARARLTQCDRGGPSGAGADDRHRCGLPIDWRRTRNHRGCAQAIAVFLWTRPAAQPCAGSGPGQRGLDFRRQLAERKPAAECTGLSRAIGRHQRAGALRIQDADLRTGADPLGRRGAVPEFADDAGNSDRALGLFHFLSAARAARLDRDGLSHRSVAQVAAALW